MSSKKIFGFLVASAGVLILSLFVVFTIILPNVQLKNPQQITAYAFNFNTSNNAKVVSIGGTNRFKLASAVRFSPKCAAQWSDEFMSFKGATVEQGVDYRDTMVAEYVCAIPFSINNSFNHAIAFRIAIEGCSGNNIEFKIYDYADREYKTLAQINGETADSFYARNGTRFNELQPRETGNYCFVAIATAENVSTNINISVSLV